MLKANFHTHTRFCDGSSTPEEMILEAIRLGFDALGFSGHVDIDPRMDLAAYQAEIRRLEEKYRDRLSILCGGELDNMFPERHPQGFDYLIGSVHHLNVGAERPLALDWTEEEMQRLLTEYYGGDGYALCRDYYRNLAETYGKGDCDFIGHFDLVTRFNAALRFVDEEEAGYLAPAFETLAYLAAQDLPLEINTRQSHWGKLYPSVPLLQKWRELGGEILISSDAHKADELTKGFAQASETAKRCGFDHTNVLRRGPDGIEFVQVGL